MTVQAIPEVQVVERPSRPQMAAQSVAVSTLPRVGRILRRPGQQTVDTPAPQVLEDKEGEEVLCSQRAIFAQRFRSSRDIIFCFFFHSSVVSETKAPSAEELAAVKLKNAQTIEGGAFGEAPYKAVWESSSGDGAKAAETIGLQGVPASYDEYIALVKSGRFKD